MSMANHTSILHISDIHKDGRANYHNLSEALKTDCNNYSSSGGIKKPNVVVVSGDIIHGGTEDEIKQQYSESKAFLEEITSFFLDGDKSRIVIVPGNHDVDWNTSRLSMKKIADEDRSKWVDDYLAVNSKIRWSWEELCFYRIMDEGVYDSRFNSFIDFYNSFYEGRQTFSTNSNEQFQIYDIPSLGLTMAGFNSCHGNDHLNHCGQIKPECITNASRKLKNFYEKGRLLIGVWHHNTSGQPFENNYLDNRILGAMIDQNIQMGLHGHQHICGAVNEFKNVFEDKRMIIFSAGTLYGGKNMLPPGASRQYNIIEIQEQESKEGRPMCQITLNSREDVSNNLFDIPSWSEGRIDRKMASSWKCKIPRLKQPDIGLRVDKIIQEAETTVDFRLAISQLIEVGIKNSIVRKVLVDFLERVGDPVLTYDVLIDPKDNEEAIMLLVAATELNDLERMKYAVDIPLIRDSEDAAVKKLRQSLTIQTEKRWQR